MCNRLFFTFIAGMFLFALTGCAGGDASKWDITVENQSDDPCSVFVTMLGGSSTASVEKLEKGKVHTMIAGSVETKVNQVKVIRLKDETEIKSEAKLGPGQRCAIVIDAKGHVTVAFVKK